MLPDPFGDQRRIVDDRDTHQYSVRVKGVKQQRGDVKTCRVAVVLANPRQRTDAAEAKRWRVIHRHHINGNRQEITLRRPTGIAIVVHKYIDAGSTGPGPTEIREGLKNQRLQGCVESGQLTLDMQAD